MFYSNSKECCGSQTYTPTLQTCSGGQVITIVQARPPPAPTPPPVYVQKVELVCDGVKWQVPYPNYACCGPSVYNVRTERCDPNRDNEYSLPPSPPSPARRGPYHRHEHPSPYTHSHPKPTPPPQNSLLTCQGHRYEVPANDYQFYACCAHQPYFWVREQCINGQISPARPVTTTTSATPQSVPVVIVCDGVQHWVSSTQRPYYGCCGSNIYDIRVDSCQAPFNPSGMPPSPPSNANCPSGYICCENYPPVVNPNGLFRCCPNIGPYDPSVANCPTMQKK